MCDAQVAHLTTATNYTRSSYRLQDRKICSAHTQIYIYMLCMHVWARLQPLHSFFPMLHSFFFIGLTLLSCHACRQTTPSVDKFMAACVATSTTLVAKCNSQLPSVDKFMPACVAISIEHSGEAFSKTSQLNKLTKAMHINKKCQGQLGFVTQLLADELNKRSWQRASK